ncbi:MAG: metal ABC transporter permease [Chryseobacterium sp.]|nr:MAG: metal ABC transporter permease [Chryseobacterium sp.]
MAITDFFSDIAQYKFLQDALFVSITLGIGCGVIGCFIVLRGLSLMGDAISHAVIPGVAVSYMLGISFFFGAVVFGLLAALSMGFIRENSKIKSDTSIGIVFSAFLALGILLISVIQSPIDLNNILFGNVLIIKSSERILTYGVVAAVLLLIVLFYKEMLLTSFDPVMAKASGLPVKFINYLVMAMLTVVTVVSLQTVGAILVVAMLITPAATAYLLTKSFKNMLWISALLGVVSAVVGLFLSVTYNLPSGVVIVLTAASLFLLVFFFSPRNGVLSNRLRKFQN